MRGQSCKVVGVMIHVVAVARLCGPAVAASVVGDDAIAVFEEEQHLRIPVIGRQRPAVAENDRLTFAPVFIIDVDVRSVFFSDSYVWHWNFLLLLFISHRKFINASVVSLGFSSSTQLLVFLILTNFG